MPAGEMVTPVPPAEVATLRFALPMIAEERVSRCGHTDTGQKGHRTQKTLPKQGFVLCAVRVSNPGPAD